MNFNKPSRDLQNTIIYLLDKETFVRPKDIAKAAISLLELNQATEAPRMGNQRLIQNPLDVISDLGDLILMKLMSVCLPDLELEGLLTDVRYSILSNISLLKGHHQL